MGPLVIHKIEQEFYVEFKNAMDKGSAIWNNQVDTFFW